MTFKCGSLYNYRVCYVPRKQTCLTVRELKRVYVAKRREIRDRLAEFARVGETGSPETLFEELTFCIYTAGASARMGLRSVESVRPVLMRGTVLEIQRALTGRQSGA